MSLLSLHLIYALGWTLLHSLWQGALVALCLAMLLPSLRKASANARYCVGVAALGLMLCLSLITFGYYYSTIGAALQAAAPHSAAVPNAGEASVIWTAQAWINHYMPHLVLLWFAGFAFYFVRYCGAFYYCYRLKNRLSLPASAPWQRTVTRLAGVLSISRQVTLKLTERISVPCVVGHIKPVILMPAALLTQLSPEELEAILLHELGHIRRHDYLVGLAQSLIKTLYFFNWPVLWISAQIDRERENACDDIAAKGCKSRTFYAETLTRFSALSIDGGLTMAVTGNQNHLLARIQRLFEPSAVSRQPFEGVVTCFLLLALGLFLSVQAQADASYPEIDTLDDVSVQQLIDTYKQQVFLAPGEGRLVTSIAPTPDLQSLTQQERQAFIQYFKQSVWNDSLANWDRHEMWESLSESEWHDLKEVFYEQRFGHFTTALSTDVPPTVFTASLAGVPEPAQAVQFDNDRWEATIPVGIIARIHQGDVERFHIGPMQVFSQQDGRLVFLMAKTENIPEFVTQRAVNSNDNKVLPDTTGRGLFTLNPASHEDHTTFFSNEDFAQISTGKPNVEKIIALEAVLIGDAMAGINVTGDGMLELALDYSRSRNLMTQMAQYVDAQYYTVDIESDSPERKQLQGTLEEELVKLPRDLHQYLYTPEQLQRRLMVASLQRGLPFSEREKPIYEEIYQRMQANMLQNLYKNNQDIEQYIKSGSATWVEDHTWVVIVPEQADDTVHIFDFIAQEKPFGEVLAMVNEKCELLDAAEFTDNLDREVSLYGYSTHCGQLQETLQTMNSGGPEITASSGMSVSE